MRVVSLIASATEIVCALGCGQFLVGRSHECDYPASVAGLPACSEPKFDIRGTSRQIDDRVKAIVRESLSVYRVDTQQLRTLKPDVIITQDHCEVCAVSLKDVEEATCDWLGHTVKVVALRPNDLEDVFRGIKEVAAALNVVHQGDALVARCRQRMNAIAETVPKQNSKPAVACIEWIEPLMAAGNWVPELIAMLGGHTCFGQAGKHSPMMSWEQLRQQDPDIIAVMPCGWDIARTRQEMPQLVKQPGWNDLKAVKHNKVYLTDGNQYFNRPGPRLVDSMEILAEILYPQNFDFHHRSQGWQLLTR